MGQEEAATRPDVPVDGKEEGFGILGIFLFCDVVYHNILCPQLFLVVGVKTSKQARDLHMIAHWKISSLELTDLLLQMAICM